MWKMPLHADTHLEDHKDSFLKSEQPKMWSKSVHSSFFLDRTKLLSLLDKIQSGLLGKPILQRV